MSDLLKQWKEYQTKKGRLVKFDAKGTKEFLQFVDDNRKEGKLAKKSDGVFTSETLIDEKKTEAVLLQVINEQQSNYRKDGDALSGYRDVRQEGALAKSETQGETDGQNSTYQMQSSYRREGDNLRDREVISKAGVQQETIQKVVNNSRTIRTRDIIDVDDERLTMMAESIYRQDYQSIDKTTYSKEQVVENIKDEVHEQLYDRFKRETFGDRLEELETLLERGNANVPVAESTEILSQIKEYHESGKSKAEKDKLYGMVTDSSRDSVMQGMSDEAAIDLVRQEIIIEKPKEYDGLADKIMAYHKLEERLTTEKSKNNKKRELRTDNLVEQMRGELGKKKS